MTERPSANILGEMQPFTDIHFRKLDSDSNVVAENDAVLRTQIQLGEALALLMNAEDEKLTAITSRPISNITENEDGSLTLTTGIQTQVPKDKPPSTWIITLNKKD